MVPALPSSLPGAIGITRVARLTGLDRSGIEVAAAIRPRGHVLQVCNGKGETREQAVAGAILEAAELWCAERVEAGRLRFGSLAELAGTAEIWGPHELGSAGELLVPELWSAQTRIAWEMATNLRTAEQVRVPAQAVRCLATGGPQLGPALVRWSTNGMGAHPQRSAALRHALLEAIERDQLARALPGGWTAGAVRSRMLVTPAEGAPRSSAAVRRIEERGFRVFLFDLSPVGSLGLAVAGALLLDTEGGPVPLAAGYAGALRPDEALLGALLEAAQSRLTDVHGAREDITQAEDSEVGLLRGWCMTARPRRSVGQMGGLGPGGLTDANEEVAEILCRLGDRRAAFVDLAPASLGIHVVKVVIPSLRVSELL